MTISQFAWAVTPKTAGSNRAIRLARELQALGVVGRQYDTWFHGRWSTEGNQHQAFVALPGTSISKQNELAILSPVFLPGFSGNAKWIDLYDDWSLAPDIRAPYRLLAAVGYKSIAKGKKFAGAPVTVNSAYMARKLGINNVHVIPNGVDPSLGSLPVGGDAKKRLIVLGHFFRGRTDFTLFERVASMPVFEEIVIGGPGMDPSVARLITKLRTRLPHKVVVQDWIDTAQLSELAGPNTVALIPHIVSDYTLSQDAMKAYTFMALGIPVICPAPIWPSAIERDYVFLAGHGDRMDVTLGDWINNTRPTTQWRSEFATQHSWARRAQRIAEVIS